MKPFKLMTSVALAASLVSVGSISAFAADGGEYESKGIIEFTPFTGITPPVDPENPGEEVEPEGPGGETPEPGTNGPLSIDFASSLDFGTQEISSQDQTYYAAAQKVTKNGKSIAVPNYVQVSDNRGTETGWGLSVTQNTEFTSTTDSDHTLAGTEIVISNIEAVTASESESPTVNTEIILDGAGVTSNVMTAANGQGAGTHLANFGDDTTKAESVALNIPGKITKYAEAYETTLTWTLTDTVANGNEDVEDGVEA
ncbi:WxL domain-containing protein [Bacillus sp. HSf4]|uniref:WxL domain-containing protein n=1 Tax=Bacillus sp. HSf4 TaxID=3035514 RepID=UPI002409F946|nr:WxL domain-containing protein [Bacillus sp. HSf4]WFA03820.1 WxL domain-containing protein [Bacillus sp. HSf4]